MSAKRRTFNRKRIIREEIPTLVIVTEGKTERLYFGGFKDLSRYSGLIIKTPPSKVTDAVSLVKFAEKLIRKHDLDLNNSDQIWCIFDRNGNTQVNLDQARKKSDENNINVAMSNPLFELWFLLHFENVESSMTKESVLDSIEKYIPDYSKTDSVFKQLLPYQKEAIKRAKKQERKYLRESNHVLKIEYNPNTSVYKLVKYLREKIGLK